MQPSLPPAEAPPPTGDSAEIELLTFRVGEQEYSVDIMQVREIRSWTHATSLPHAPAFVRGVINLRGTVLPVLDLALRLGLATEGPDARHVIIVVQSGGRTVGLRVDAVSDILTIPRSELQAPPELATGAGRGFVQSLTLIEGRMVRLLDLDQVLPGMTEEAA
ncbi:chemotaxis protein CheW [Palleronia sp. KMU-117]|uniref:chemotaxis protein CheW n=1 Tax=Palleronia sp. KMU-117 TaxID=3434108 RepID=UPI003D74A12E